MYPEGTVVRYKGQLAVVKFVDQQSQQMVICINTFPNEPRRDVCLVLCKDQFDDVELENGNHSRQHDY